MTRPTMDQIIAAVVAAFGIGEVEIISPRRQPETIIARKAVYFLAATLTIHSLPHIGARIGGRDHTTVLHGIRAAKLLYQLDGGFRAQVDQALALIDRDHPQLPAVINSPPTTATKTTMLSALAGRARRLADVDIELAADDVGPLRRHNLIRERGLLVTEIVRSCEALGIASLPLPFTAGERPLREVAS